MKSEHGQTLIEFAFVAIIFFVLLLGIFEFGFLMYNQQVITNAAREGARSGIVARLSTATVNNKITEMDVEGKARQYAESFIVSFSDKNFIAMATFEPTPPATTADYCTGFQKKLTVNVKYDYSFLFLPFAKRTLGSTAVMYCE